MNFNKKTLEHMKKSFFKTTTIGLSVLMFPAFLTGCSQANNKVNTQESVVIEQTETKETIEETITSQLVEEIEYLDMDVKDILLYATKLDANWAESKLQVTEYTLQGLKVYITEDGTYCILSGNQPIPLSINEDGFVIFEDGVTRYQVEGYRTYMDFIAGSAKEEYQQKLTQTENVDKQSLKDVVLLINGVIPENLEYTDPMAAEFDGKYYINLAQLAECLGFGYGYVDCEIQNPAVEGEMLDCVTLTVFDGTVTYSFEKNSNRVLLITETTKEEKKFLNVGEEKTLFKGNLLWIPVEYLETAFGIEYKIENNVITIISGHIVPKVVLLDSVESIGYVSQP